VRVAWNKFDPNLLATFALDSNRLIVLDVRVRRRSGTPGRAAGWAVALTRLRITFSLAAAQVPAVALHELNSHTAPINSFVWAPHMKHGLCTASALRPVARAAAHGAGRLLTAPAKGMAGLVV